MGKGKSRGAGGPATVAVRQPLQRPRTRREAAAERPLERRTDVSPYARERLHEVFGRDLSVRELRGLVGAADNAIVEITYHSRDGAVAFSVHGPAVTIQSDYVAQPDGTFGPGTYRDFEYTASRELEPINGVLTLVNDTFRVHPQYQGRGTGLRMIARQVKTLSSLRGPDGEPVVRQLGAFMAGWRRSSDQGYQVWPRMGYNADLKPSDRRAFVRDRSMPLRQRLHIFRLGNRATLLDLYQTPQGRAWWREHGKAIGGTFDLRDGSRSRQVLDAYLKEKGIDWNAL